MAASALSGSYVSACDLSSALGRLFSAVAVVVGGHQTRQRDGREHPVSSRRAARDPLFAVVVQTLHINAYGANSWRETIRTSHEQSVNRTKPKPKSPAPEPAPAPAAASDAEP